MTLAIGALALSTQVHAQSVSASAQPAPVAPAHKHGKHAAGQAGPVAKLDSDKDGRISWAEFDARMKARFDALDTNHDGFLDPAEVKSGRKTDKQTWGALDSASASKTSGDKPAP